MSSGQPDFQIVSAGKKLDALGKGRVLRIVVDERVDQAALCSIELSDLDAKVSEGPDFKVGSELKVELGEVGKTKLVFEGEVTGWRGAFRRRGARTLTVVAHCRFHRLRRDRKSKTFLGTKDSDMVNQLAAAHGLSVQAEASSISHRYVLQANESDADFLLRRAAAIGYEAFVDGKKLVFRKPPLKAAPALELEWGKSLKRFEPVVSLGQQSSTVTMTGFDMLQKKPIVQKVDVQGATQSMGTKSGAQAAKNAGPAVAHSRVPLIDPGEAETAAKAAIAAASSHYVTGEGAVAGNPLLRRGVTVSVEAIGPLLSGHYYVSGTVHTLDRRGYETVFFVRRTGVGKEPDPLPANAPGGATQGTKSQSNPGKCEFIVANQFGDPIEGLDYVLTAPDGEKTTGKLPPNGVVAVENAKAGTYTLALKGVDPPSIREAPPEEEA